MLISRASMFVVVASLFLVCLPGMAEPTSETWLWGDVDDNGITGTVDASLILQFDAFSIDQFPCCPEVRPAFPERGDVNADGVLGTIDASLILQFDAFRLDCFPADLDCDGHGPEPTPTPTPTATPTGPQELTVMLPGNVPLVMVPIPAGSFQMGSNDGPDWSWCGNWDPPCEQPVHTVTFAQPFYMGKYPVTQRQWQAVMGNNPSWFTNRPEAPVERVSWHDCQGFVTALNNHIASSGQGPATFRLPSEAEWEYACRAGTTTRFYFGDSNCNPTGSTPCDLSDYAWWWGNNTSEGYPSGTKPVGLKLPNAWGLHDMHGNVWEWCLDWWNGNYVGAPTDGSPWYQGDSSSRVIRGGYWRNDARRCRSACRYGYRPTSSLNLVGFRLARTW